MEFLLTEDIALDTELITNPLDEDAPKATPTPYPMNPPITPPIIAPPNP